MDVRTGKENLVRKAGKVYYTSEPKWSAFFTSILWNEDRFKCVLLYEYFFPFPEIPQRWTNFSLAIFLPRLFVYKYYRTYNLPTYLPTYLSILNLSIIQYGLY